MYDIDTLFIMRKSKWGKESVDVHAIMKKYLVLPDDTTGVFKLSDKGFPGFKNNKEETFNNQHPAVVLEQALIAIDKYIIDISSKLRTETSRAKKIEYEDALKLANLDFDVIHSALEVMVKNSIVHNFSSNLRNSKNRHDLLTPISFSRVGSVRSTLLNELHSKLSEETVDEQLLKDLEKAGAFKLIC